MAVDERERQRAELGERVDAQVANGAIGQSADEPPKEPLRKRSGYYHEGQADQDGLERHEVDPARADERVDGVADEDGHVELQDHGGGGADKGCHERQRVAAHIGRKASQHLADRH